MSWLPEEEMADIHIIRQDFARAKHARETDFSIQAEANYQDAWDRRARAIRMVHQETDMSVRHLASMFRTTKPVIRQALEEEVE